MKKTAQIAILLSLVLLTFVSVQAQTPTVSPTPAQEQPEDVVRITTNLVQLDAVVTDKDGNPVTNLTPDDFEVYQDGKLQKVTNFSFVKAELPRAKTSASAKSSNELKIAPPPARVSVGNANRILTFIVDDGNCTASRIGMIASRGALEKFINEQMQPNDLVAIYQTRGGSSLLQQYTSDKNRLMRSVRQIRWQPPALSCGGNTGDFFEPNRADTTLKSPGRRQTFETEDDVKRRERNEDYTRDNQTVGTIGVLRYVIRGLQRVPGRKTVFFLSDGLPLRTRENKITQAQEALRSLTDLANRASVVFQAIDVRGNVDPSVIQASDEVLTGDIIDHMKPSGTSKIVADRSFALDNTRNGLFFLANETGGRFYHSSNYLDVPIRRALNSEMGYYLLAYQPEDETFKGKKFHGIEIKLKRPDLKVYSRAGFYGLKDEEIRPKAKIGDSELYEAISAPLPDSNLNLQLSAFFGSAANKDGFVRSLIHVDGKDIAFVDEPDNKKKVVFDVLAVTLNEKNEVADEFNYTYTLRLAGESLSLLKQNGLVYSVDVPVKKAGAYTFRVAMRDANSKQLGVASQLIEVPDLKKGKLFVSGLAASAVDQSGKFVVPSTTKPENGFSLTASQAVPAIRRFRGGAILAYSYLIYNAQIDKAANQPKLTVKLNLYRDGQLISEGQPQPLQLAAQTDLTRISDFGYLRLKPNMPPADYALQIIVTDMLTNQTAAQWIDFEVTK
ncbi:MAG TPA: VWA domain-containing protein [Pyrinomonadaceae bacterium]|jgi:VWFA-related protein